MRVAVTIKLTDDESCPRAPGDILGHARQGNAGE